MSDKVYYKSFDQNLFGRNGFQYAVGQSFQTDQSEDNWRWLHYSQYLSFTLIHSPAPARICTVIPQGKIKQIKCSMDGYNKGYYYGTTQLFIERELPRDEILAIAEEEDCRFWMIMDYLHPPFEWLLEHKSHIRGTEMCGKILRSRDLTDEQVYALLPNSKKHWFHLRENLKHE